MSPRIPESEQRKGTEMANGNGRERNDAVVTVGMKPSELERLRAACAEIGVPQARLLREAGLREAERRLAAHRRMEAEVAV